MNVHAKIFEVGLMFTRKDCKWITLSWSTLGVGFNPYLQILDQPEHPSLFFQCIHWHLV
jgi:hypothetical protein